MRKENIFYCDGEITHTCINSKNTILFISTYNKIIQIFNLNLNKSE